MELCGAEGIQLMKLIQRENTRIDKFLAGAVLKRLALQPGGTELLTKSNDIHELLATTKITISPLEYCKVFGSTSSKKLCRFQEIDTAENSVSDSQEKYACRYIGWFALICCLIRLSTLFPRLTKNSLRA